MIENDIEEWILKDTLTLLESALWERDHGTKSTDLLEYTILNAIKRGRALAHHAPHIEGYQPKGDPNQPVPAPPSGGSSARKI